MEQDLSQILYTVALTGVRDESSQAKLAQTLASVSGRLPMEAVMKRLNALPWTLTRKASYKRAYRLAKLLESMGGEVSCVPPLPKSTKPVMDETLILPSAELISQTQIMSSTQLISRTNEPAVTVASPPAAPHESAPVEPREKELPPVTAAPASPPARKEDVEEVTVGFFSKHKETILVLILSAVVTLSIAWFLLYMLDRLGFFH